MTAVFGTINSETTLERALRLLMLFTHQGNGDGCRHRRGRGLGLGRFSGHRREKCRRAGLLHLSEMMENQVGLVKEVHCPGPVRRRLLDMGIVPGVRLLMERRAPLGDPIEVKCKTFHISLRLEEARGILVEVEGDGEGETES